MRGHSLHRYLTRLRGVTFVGKARIRAKLYIFSGREYPGATPGRRGRQFVYGELYRLRSPERALKLLDQIEGCDEGLFRRQLVDVWTNSRKTKAWSYFYARTLDDARPIPTGRFVSEQGASTE